MLLGGSFWQYDDRIFLVGSLGNFGPAQIG